MGRGKHRAGDGKAVLLSVGMQCVTTDRSLHLHVLLPFLSALTHSEALIASFLASLWSPQRGFPLMAALILWEEAEGNVWVFLSCWMSPVSPSRLEAEQVRQSSNHNYSIQLPLMPCENWALCNTTGTRELCEMHLLLHFVISGVGCANGGLQSLLLLSALSAQGIHKYAAHTSQKQRRFCRKLFSVEVINHPRNECHFLGLCYMRASLDNKHSQKEGKNGFLQPKCSILLWKRGVLAGLPYLNYHQRQESERENWGNGNAKKKAGKKQENHTKLELLITSYVDKIFMRSHSIN